MRRYRLRATAITYLHVKYIDREAFTSLGVEFPLEISKVRRYVVRDQMKANLMEAAQREKKKMMQEGDLAGGQDHKGHGINANGNDKKATFVNDVGGSEELDDEDIVISSLSPGRRWARRPPTSGSDCAGLRYVSSASVAASAV